MKNKLKHRQTYKPPKNHAWHYLMNVGKEKTKDWIYTQPKKDIYSYAA